MSSLPKTRYWFPRKPGGWGFGPPQTWEGWIVLLTFVAGVITYVTTFNYNAQPLLFAAGLVLLCLGFNAIVWWTGEPKGHK